MKFDPGRRLAEAELKELFRYISSSGGTVILSKHAKERMQERGYSLRDIIHIITNGSLTRSEYNESFANWNYTFKGKDIDGDAGGVVLSVDTQYNCVIITVLS
jgi:alanine-alpha-ketoisovalerate/valine-pyruvate aminotransferase